MDNKPRLKEIPFHESTIENIDKAVYEWLNDKMDIYTETNQGWEKVRVNWVGQERSFQIKNNKDIRNSNGLLILPVISIKRTSFKKSQSDKRSIPANVPYINDTKGGSSITIGRRIKQDKTSYFANADAKRKWNSEVRSSFGRSPRKKNEKIVYETITIPVPIYLTSVYTFEIQTEYQLQMNDIITSFMTYSQNHHYHVIKRNGHRYECLFEEDIALNDNLSNFEESERIFKNSINMRVEGYIIGAGKNQKQPKIVVRENAVEVKFGRERSVFGDEPTHIDDNRKWYRKL